MLESESAYAKLLPTPPPSPHKKKTSSSYSRHTDYIVSFSWELRMDWINLWAEEHSAGHLSKNQITSFIIQPSFPVKGMVREIYVVNF